MKVHAYFIHEHFEVNQATLFYKPIFDRCIKLLISLQNTFHKLKHLKSKSYKSNSFSKDNSNLGTCQGRLNTKLMIKTLRNH